MANEIAAGFKGLESLAHGGTKMGEYSAHAAEHLPKTAVGEKLGTLPAGSTLNGASLDTIAAIDGNAAKIKDARGLAIDKDGNVSPSKPSAKHGSPLRDQTNLAPWATAPPR
jgi:hypothetical protein